MLINEKTALSSSHVLLVPYSKHHVPRYHEWMKDPDIQQATASEPLSLEEEYSMQASWRRDADKLTFIICLPLPATAETGGGDGDIQAITDPKYDADDVMVGDVNLFLTLEGDDDDDDECEQGTAENGGVKSSSRRRVVGELELMIAEKQNQRRGLGRAALVCFLRYVTEHEKEIVGTFLSGLLSSDSASASSEPDATAPSASEHEFRLAYLVVKIGKENIGSLALFESLGFVKVTEKTNVFGELELRKVGFNCDQAREMLDKSSIRGYRELHYDR